MEKERREAAILSAIDRICQDYSTEYSYTPAFKHCLTNVILRQSLVFAADLEAFAKYLLFSLIFRHARRNTVNNADVKLLCRRNESVSNALQGILEKK